MNKQFIVNNEGFSALRKSLQDSADKNQYEIDEIMLLKITTYKNMPNQAQNIIVYHVADATVKIEPSNKHIAGDYSVYIFGRNNEIISTARSTLETIAHVQFWSEDKRLSPESAEHHSRRALIQATA